MNALMNIQVRVTGGNAQATLAQIKAAIAQVGLSAGTASGGVVKFDAALLFKNIENSGKQLQWLGRQLEYSFTLPFVAAAGAALDFENKQAAAFVGLTNNYNSAGLSASQFKTEINLVGVALTDLSNIFGVNKATVEDIATTYAKAGATGATLAQDTRNSLEAVTLGMGDTTQATTNLIAIQELYGASQQQMKQYIEDMVMTTRTVPVTFDDLSVAIQRSGGVATAAGIEFNQLLGLITTMVPITGDAATAGNALRTIITRLFAPTKDATTILGEMGINVNTATWQAQNGVQRVQTLAAAFENLSQGQKIAVSNVIASRFQVSRFDVLMGQIASSTGNYNRVLDATNNKQQEAAKYTQMLGNVLSSSPQAWKILWTQLQNGLAQIIIPLIPAIESLASRIVSLVNSFTQLSPQTQQMILTAAMLLAAIGPIMRYVGALEALGGRLGKMGVELFKVFKWLDGKDIFATFWNFLKYPFQTVANGLSAIWSAMFGGEAASVGAGAATGTAQIAETEAAVAEVIAVNEEGAAAVEEIWATIAPVVTAAMAEPAAAVEGTWAGVVEGIDAMMGEIVATSGAAATASTIGWAEALAAIDSFIATIDMSAGAAAVGAAGEMDAAAGASAIGWAEALAAIDAFIATLPESMAAADVEIGAAYSALLAYMESITAGGGAVIEGEWAGIVEGIDLIMAAGGAEAGMGFMATLIGALTGVDEVALIVAAVAAALAAVAFVVYKYWDDIQKYISDFLTWMVNAMGTAWNALPEIISTAFGAVIDVINRAVTEVSEGLSYLNPFAKHSPSLVEQVQNGVQVIGDQYGNLTGTQGVYQQAADAHQNFLQATGQSDASALNPQTIASQRSTVAQDAPQNVGVYDATIAAMRALYVQMQAVDAEYAKQASVVATDKSALDAANATLTTAKDKLAQLEAGAAATSTALQAAKTELTDLSQTGIQGMTAMSDAIFANEQAQKSIQLQLLQLQDAGQNVESTTQKLSDLQGLLETMRGQANDLRLQGAGSDVLNPLNAQIQSLTDQQRGLQGLGGGDQVSRLQAQLATLQQQGQELGLQSSLMFDPLTRQLQRAANGINELPFAELMSRTVAAKATVDTLTATYTQQSNAVTAQKAVVDQLTASRDALKTSYDTENGKLTSLKDTYTAMSTQFKAMSGDLASYASNLKSAASSSSQNVKDFNAAADANFPAPTMGALPDPTGDLQGLIDQWNNEIKKSFGTFDPFAPFKKTISGIGDWIKRNATDIIVGALMVVLTPLAGPLTLVAGAIYFAFTHGWLDPVINFFGTVGSLLAGWIGTVGGWMTTAWQAVIGAIQTVFRALVTFFNAVIYPVWRTLASVVSTVASAVGGIISAMWKFIYPILHAFWDFFNTYLLPILQMFAAIAMIQVNLVIAAIGILWQTAQPLLSLFWQAIQHVGDIFTWLGTNVFDPVARDIGAVVSLMWNTYVKPVFDAIQGIIRNVIGPTITWLWNNIASPAFNGIATVAGAMWNGVINPVFKAINGFIRDVLAPTVTWLWHTIIEPAFNAIGGLISGAFNIALSVVSTVWDTILGVATAGVNNLIGVFNMVAHAINWITDKLPGIKIHIDDIPLIGVKNTDLIPVPKNGALLAAGGMVGAGFTTRGPQAIVGEGNPAFPEYVIPTDPTYRRNAVALYESLGTHLYAGGGLIGIIGGAINTVGNAVGDIANAAIDATISPLRSAATAAAGALSRPFDSIADGVINATFDWLKSEVGSVTGHASGGILGVPFNIFDQGGALPTGLSLAYNGTGSREQVLSPTGGRAVNHFYGDLVFPNVEDGSDAEDFIRNLEALV